jgi:hypothetical protein
MGSVVEGRDATQDRATIREAALRLDIKEDAVRKRTQLGSIRHEKAEDTQQTVQRPWWRRVFGRT